MRHLKAFHRRLRRHLYEIPMESVECMGCLLFNWDGCMFDPKQSYQSPVYFLLNRTAWFLTQYKDNQSVHTPYIRMIFRFLLPRKIQKG
jgi:hypothetical protein